MKKSIRKTLSAAVAAAMCAGLAGAMPAAPVSAANGMGTYEVETFEGVDQVWTSIYENQLPGYYGDGFAYLTAAPISIEIEAEKEGMYEIDVRAAQILSTEGRMQTISINGIDYTYNMPYLSEWTDVNFGVFRLKEGVNEITLKPNYGYAAYDTMTIKEADFPSLDIASDETCDPDATPEAKALLKYLKSVYGKNILSGQQEIYGGGHGMQSTIRYDAATDTCVDQDGNVYTFNEEDKGTLEDTGETVVWSCYGADGQKYNYDQQSHGYTYNDYNTECRYLYELTGDYPAIRGFDFNCHNPGFAWEDGVTERMIDWAVNKNGIVTASWHCTVPTSMDDFEIDEDGNITKISNDWQKFTYTQMTDFHTANCMVEGTKEYVFYQEAIKLVAAELQKLQDAGVPVIFRPLHEAEGNPGNNADGSGAWFWWSKEGAEVYNQLWKLLYTTLTEEYGIHNLIWEQNLYAWSEESALWYTGDEWVDIVGFDKYNTQYNRHDGKTEGPNEDAESKIYWSLVDYVKGGKMVSMPENSTIPSLENLQIEHANWLYFCTWYDDQDKFISGENYQNADTVKEMFQSDYCITLSELPEDLSSYDGDITTPTEVTPTEDTPTEVTPTETDAPDPTDASVPDDVLYGDADGNGSVQMVDMILVNKYLMIGTEISPQGLRNADVNLNGEVEADDGLNILRYVIDLITLPVTTAE